MVIDGELAFTIEYEKADEIQHAFQLAATTNMTLSELAENLAEAGLTSNRGKPMNSTTLWHILTNPIYAGRYRNGSPSAWPPIISITTFITVQQNLSTRARSIPRFAR
jgi:hypothetical protein